MAKTIRADLEGVVYVRRGAFGEPLALRAGDKVPRGVTIGDHLTAKGDDTGAPDDPTAEQQAAAEAAAKAAAEAEQKAKDEAAAAAAAGSQGQPDSGALPEPPRSGAGSGVEAWQTYADAIGVEYPEGAGRDEIIALVDDARS